jgi:hypothetical protein
MSSSSARMPAQVPLLIGITGHRDLLAEEMPPLREAARGFLSRLRNQFPDAPLRLVSSLSGGADLLVTEEALDLGVECIAVLPLPVELYRKDFDDPDELQRFELALARCTQCMGCAIKVGATLEDIAQPGPARTAQYAAAGEIIAAVSFILLALWDGNVAMNAAGTARTVEFRFARRAWLDDASSAHQELLPNLPPDLVYHIVTSRRRGTLATGLMPLQQGYRRGPGGPLEAHLPASAVLVAERTAELDRDLLRHAESIAHDASTEELTDDLAAAPASVIQTARLFGAIDWFASRMRSNVMRTLYATSALMILMGGFFLIYNHSEGCQSCQYSILGFLGAFTAVLGINLFAGTQRWHRRYLESRALAEGLRVELFWAIAGVSARSGTPAVHRALLKQADPGLEWIPNAIRAASLTLSEVRQTGIAGGLEFAMRKWVGVVGESDSRSQQLHYYWHASRAKAALSSFAEWLSRGSVVIGFGIACVLVVELLLGKQAPQRELMFCIGFFSLVGGVIEALGHKTADRELQRQYEYMYRVFLAAHDRLMAAHSDEDRRAILALLGRTALTEHAEWLLVHRDRPIDRSRLQ